jgi:formate dehydrogenase maturation protein FdhE
MATDKKFAVAGVSTLAGKTKIRFANDAMRVKILAKNGHSDVDLIELPREMTKAEIVQHMVEVGFGKGNAAVEAAIKDLAKKNKVDLKAKVSTVTAGKAETVTAE